MESLRVPEVEIIKAINQALENELPLLIEAVNDEKLEEWIFPFETVKTDRQGTDSARKPAAALQTYCPPT